MDLLLASAAGYGTWLLYTALALGWSGLAPSPSPRWSALAARARRRGRGSSGRAEAAARAGWPPVLDELALRVALGDHPLGPALYTAGRRAPGPLGRAFTEAEDAWRRSGDPVVGLDVLRDRVDDAPSAVVSELLLMAHTCGCPDLPDQLRGLAADLRLQRRREAELERRRPRRSLRPRRSALGTAVPDVADHLSLLLLAGWPLRPALERVARCSPPPCGAALDDLLRRSGGMTMTAALRTWADDLGVPEVDALVRALTVDRVATDVGTHLGDLARRLREDHHCDRLEQLARRPLLRRSTGSARAPRLR